MVSETDKDPKGDFDARLRTARARLGKDGGEDGDEREREALSGGYRMGVEFVAAVAVGAFLGYWLDRWFDTAPVLMIGMTCLGVAAGIRNLMRLLEPGTAGRNEDET